MEDPFVHVNHVEQLKALAHELAVRPDWDEPSNQGVNAFVIGKYLDNAKGSMFDGAHGEINVVITVDSNPVGIINLATLLAFACGTYKGE